MEYASKPTYRPILLSCPHSHRWLWYPWNSQNEWKEISMLVPVASKLANIHHSYTNTPVSFTLTTEVKMEAKLVTHVFQNITSQIHWELFRVLSWCWLSCFTVTCRTLWKTQNDTHFAFHTKLFTSITGSLIEGPLHYRTWLNVREIVIILVAFCRCWMEKKLKVKILFPLKHTGQYNRPHLSIF